MEDEAPEQAFADVGEVIAANLRRLRTARRMSLATLASRADVAKATLANLEQGRGNPTIETLWSLALGLGVAFSDLLEDRRETTTVIVRAQQGAQVRGSTAGGQLGLRLVDRIERGGLIELFDLSLPARTDHLGRPHGIGVVERVFVHAGTITVGPASEPITLGPGDYARYSGDGPHVYRSAGEDVRGMLLVGYPPALRPEASRPGLVVVPRQFARITGRRRPHCLGRGTGTPDARASRDRRGENSMKLTDQQIARFVEQGGFTGGDRATAIAIVLAESGGNSAARGDTLSGIASSHGLTLDRLRALNPGLFDAAHHNGSMIHPGEVVKL